MAKVVFNHFLARLISSKELNVQENDVLDVDGKNVREISVTLCRQFPSLAGKLDSGVAVAIDGEIFSEAWFEELNENSEVYFLPAIEGG
ncbi:hypothetical protein NBRC116493_25140 [Aurantivibrio infirmus]